MKTRIPRIWRSASFAKLPWSIGMNGLSLRRFSYNDIPKQKNPTKRPNFRSCGNPWWRFGNCEIKLKKAPIALLLTYVLIRWFQAGIFCFLAHLSQRLIWWVYRIGIPPSSVVVVRQKFWCRTSSTLFKHLLLRNHWANQSQISYGAFVG